MAIPGNVGNYNPSAKRGAFARSPEKPSSAKRGVFGASPSAAKKGIFAFTPSGGGSGSAFAPKKTSFAPSPRQAEDYSMDLLQKRREQTRQDFFKGREDISPSRLDRRQIQADLLEQFKQTQMKPVVGSSNLLQSVTPGGPTMADESMRLANMYGPTLKEIRSDIGYGFSQIGKGLAEKGTPLMNLLKSIYGGVQSFFTPNQGSGTMDQFSQFKQGLTNPQLAIFNYHMNSGNSPDFARQMALMGKPLAYANGGIATLS